MLSLPVIFATSRLSRTILSGSLAGAVLSVYTPAQAQPAQATPPQGAAEPEKTQPSPASPKPADQAKDQPKDQPTDQPKSGQPDTAPKAQPSPATAPSQPKPAQPESAPGNQAASTTQPEIPQGLTAGQGQKSAQASPAPKETTAGPAVDPSISPEEMQRRMWRSRHRPAHNPVRFQGTFRAGVFAGGQSKRSAGGRGIGLELETGITRNYFSAALALGTHFGRYNRVPLDPLPHHPEVALIERPKHPGYKTPAGFSTGLRAGIGRLALQGTGFIAPQIGYDFTWFGIKRISGHRPKKVATAHGPSIRLDAGFQSFAPHKRRQFRRVFGASLGWNMVVGGIGTKLPTSHFVFLGLFAQMN